MTLLLHDSLASSHLVHPFAAGWIETDLALGERGNR